MNEDETFQLKPVRTETARWCGAPQYVVVDGSRLVHAIFSYENEALAFISNLPGLTIRELAD